MVGAVAGASLGAVVGYWVTLINVLKINHSKFGAAGICNGEEEQVPSGNRKYQPGYYTQKKKATENE